MSVYDLFRGFFGVPGRRDPFFGGISRDEEDDEEEDGDGQDYPFGSRPHDNFGPGGSHFHGSFGFEDVFQDFNKLFTDMEQWMSRPLELPSTGEFPVDRGRGQSLRDAMLKDPESDIPKSDERSFGPEAEAKENPGFMSPERRLPWRPFGRFEDLWKVQPHTGKDGSREDKDLDSEVSSDGLDTVLRSPEPKTKSYFKSVSVTKVMSPDGTIEEHRTVKDSQGKTETTVSRRKGDQVFERIMTKNEQGAEEVTEKMINMDDRDLGQFGGLKEGVGTDMKDASSILDRFFRGFFSGR